jgi:hypothetical protein
MTIGMLWFDKSPKLTIQEKVRNAAAAHKKKYYKEANICLVHFSMMPEGISTLDVDGITVKAWKAIMPSHFWIGLEDEPEKEVQS